MTRIDQFESVFKASSKQLYEPGEVSLSRLLVVTDLDAYETRLFADQVRSFLSGIAGADDLEWSEVAGERFTTVKELLELVEEQRPDVVCTYRNLHSGAWRWPFSLGSYVEVLTQATTTPVLLLPSPHAQREGMSPPRLVPPEAVMAITDHLSGDSRLVDWAARFTVAHGRLLLSHVEDSTQLEKYLELIGKIPALDTEVAREEITLRLLKEPSDYVESCRAALARPPNDVDVRALVGIGHRLHENVRLVTEHGVGLLVLNTKDQDQLAMHGLAYSLAVELRDVPMLLL